MWTIEYVRSVTNYEEAEPVWVTNVEPQSVLLFLFAVPEELHDWDQ
jgi:hypothetical protein